MLYGQLLVDYIEVCLVRLTSICNSCVLNSVFAVELAHLSFETITGCFFSVEPPSFKREVIFSFTAVELVVLRCSHMC